jgi:hypothetical protein
MARPDFIFFADGSLFLCLLIGYFYLEPNLGEGIPSRPSLLTISGRKAGRWSRHQLSLSSLDRSRGASTALLTPPLGYYFNAGMCDFTSKHYILAKEVTFALSISQRLTCYSDSIVCWRSLTRLGTIIAIPLERSTGSAAIISWASIRLRRRSAFFAIS